MTIFQKFNDQKRNELELQKVKISLVNASLQDFEIAGREQLLKKAKSKPPSVSIVSEEGRARQQNWKSTTHISLKTRQKDNISDQEDMRVDEPNYHMSGNGIYKLPRGDQFDKNKEQKQINKWTTDFQKKRPNIQIDSDSNDEDLIEEELEGLYKPQGGPFVSGSHRENGFNDFYSNSKKQKVNPRASNGNYNNTKITSQMHRSVDNFNVKSGNILSSFKSTKNYLKDMSSRIKDQIQKNGELGLVQKSHDVLNRSDNKNQTENKDFDILAHRKISEPANAHVSISRPEANGNAKNRKINNKTIEEFPESVERSSVSDHRSSPIANIVDSNKNSNVISAQVNTWKSFEPKNANSNNNSNTNPSPRFAGNSKIIEFTSEQQLKDPKVSKIDFSEANENKGSTKILKPIMQLSEFESRNSETKGVLSEQQSRVQNSGFKNYNDSTVVKNTIINKSDRNELKPSLVIFGKDSSSKNLFNKPNLQIISSHRESREREAKEGGVYQSMGPSSAKNHTSNFQKFKFESFNPGMIRKYNDKNSNDSSEERRVPNHDGYRDANVQSQSNGRFTPAIQYPTTKTLIRQKINEEHSKLTKKPTSSMVDSKVKEIIIKKQANDAIKNYTNKLQKKNALEQTSKLLERIRTKK